MGMINNDGEISFSSNLISTAGYDLPVLKVLMEYLFDAHIEPLK